MKKTIFLIIAIVVSLSFHSCDKIDGAYLEQSHGATSDTPSFPVLSNPIQKVILEEFTGHTCVNCPQGHVIAADIKMQYGDTMILMAIHAGSTAEPVEGTNYTADYRTAAGDELKASFGVSSNPAGLVNRTAFGGNVVLDKSNWAEAVRTIDKTHPSLAIQLEKVEDNSAKAVNIFAKITFLQTIQKNIKLSLFLTEDSIISPQKSLGAVSNIIDYVHRHMLRAAVNSVWGDQIANNSTPNQLNTSLIRGYSFSFNGKPFVKNQCSIIAVAYDVDTKEVIQVEEIHLSN